MELLVGTAGFLLFFLYDWNRVFWKCRWMSSFFTAGCLCQIFSGARLLYWIWVKKNPGWIMIIAVSMVCLAGLIYTLFFALPFDSTYCREADRHKVCRSGIYGVCRHPGIWWFFGCFVSLGAGCNDAGLLGCGIWLSLLNLLYAWYQDKWIFPEEFSDYRDYQKEVPFLLPRLQCRDR